MASSNFPKQFAFALVALVLSMSSLAWAQGTPQAFNGLQAGAQAFAQQEALRQDAFNRQLGLVEVLKQQAIERAIAERYTPTALLYRPFTPTWSGAPGQPLYVDSFQATYGTPFYPGITPAGVYNYYQQPVRQPIGRMEVQTGPRRWESHPIYSPPLRYEEPVETAAPVERSRPKPKVIDNFPNKQEF